MLVAYSLFAQGAGQDRNDKPLSVCEILASPMNYDGKLLAVRGVWEGSGEGSWIEAGTKCTNPFKTYGYVWPQIIWFETADSPQRIHKVDYHTDLGALRIVNEEIRKKGLDPNANRIWLTFIGVFETRNFQPSDIGSDGRGGVRPNGFGHLNSAPGQFLVRTVRDLKVEPK